MSPDKKPTTPLDCYVRVSRVGDRDVEAEGGTAAEQEKRCRAQLEASGLKAGQVFTDLDESGGKESRPEFDKALARIQAGESGGLVVLNLSRFGRNRKVPLLIEQIEDWGGTLLSVEEKLDTSTPMGKFAVDILAAVNTLYLEQVRDQWRRTKERVRASGVHIGAARAGYVRQEDGTLVEHPEYLAAVTEAFALRARGGSWREAAAILTEAGVPTSKSGGASRPWSRQATRNVIQNRAYRADEGGPIPTWQWERAQPRADEARVRGEGHVLGQGLVRCSVCGAGMHKSSNGQRYVVLRCDTAGTGHPTISYDTAADCAAQASALRSCESSQAHSLRQPGQPLSRSQRLEARHLGFGIREYGVAAVAAERGACSSAARKARK